MLENVHTVTTRKAWMRRLTSIFGLALVLLASLLAAHDVTFMRATSISRPSLDHSSLSVKTESLYAYDRLIRPSPDQPGSLAIYHYDGPGFAPTQTPSSPLPYLIPALLPLLTTRRPLRPRQRNASTTTPPQPLHPKRTYAYHGYSSASAQVHYYGYRYCAPSEAWHLLRGESPRRKFLKGGSQEGQELATRFVASLAGVKERRKRMNNTTEA